MGRPQMDQLRTPCRGGGHEPRSSRLGGRNGWRGHKAESRRPRPTTVGARWGHRQHARRSSRRLVGPSPRCSA